jgi:predicted secreted Zn-dependent protease
MIAVPEPPAADHVVWRKSSLSGANGNCVEVALTPRQVLVRDSEDPSGPLLTFTFAQWECFIEGVRRGEFNGPPA